MLRLGLDRIDITPPGGIYLVGYADRAGGNNGAHDSLTATTAVFESDDGCRTVLVFLDMLGLNRKIHNRIKKNVSRRLKLNGLFLCCSHTHSGPIGWAPEKAGAAAVFRDIFLRTAALPAGRSIPAGVLSNKSYIDSLVRKLSGAIITASEDTRPIELYSSRAPLSIGINRRENTKDGIIIGENPEGPAPAELTLVQARAADGKVLLNIVNYDCHAVFFGPQSYAVSADWPGEMRRIMEENNQGFCVFLQGGSGNINPKGMRHDAEASVGDQEKGLLNAGQTAADAVFDAMERLNPVASERLLVREERIDIPIKNGPGYKQALAEAAGMPGWIVDPVLNLRYPWKTESSTKPDGSMTTPVYCGYAELGGISLATLSMEPFFETSESVKNLLPGTPLFGGYTNGLTGYLPTAVAFAEGGYEVEMSPFMYRLPGLLDKNAENLVLEAFERMMGPEPAPAAVRPATAEDEAAVTEVCHRTFYDGPDFPNPRLIGLRWAVWYVRNSPNYSFVAVDDNDRPVGYILSAVDSNLYRQSYHDQILPLIRIEMDDLKKTNPGLYRKYRFVFLPPVDEYAFPFLKKIVRSYPAHLHIDLLPEYQKTGIGGRLMKSLIGRLKEAGISGVHIIVGADNENAVGFYSRFGFEILVSRKRFPDAVHIMGLKLN